MPSPQPTHRSQTAACIPREPCDPSQPQTACEDFLWSIGGLLLYSECISKNRFVFCWRGARGTIWYLHESCSLTPSGI